jgi:hypothetical protein
VHRYACLLAVLQLRMLQLAMWLTNAAHTTPAHQVPVTPNMLHNGSTIPNTPYT